MLAKLLAFFRLKKEQEIIQEDTEPMIDTEDDDAEKTVMVDTLRYHQPSKEEIAEKAKRLAQGDKE